MMSWFDSTSSSISGFFSQAQKSIDKVLDIPREEGDRGKRNEIQASKTDTKLSSTDNIKETTTNNKEVSSVPSSWLSGDDLFWASFVTTANVDDKPKKADRTLETEIDKNEGENGASKIKEKLASQKTVKSLEKKDKPKKANSKLNASKRRKPGSNPKQEKVPEPVETKERVGPIEGKERVGPIDPKERVGPVEAKESVGPIDPKERVGPLEAKERVGPVEAEGYVEPVKTKERVEPVKTKERVGSVELAEGSVIEKELEDTNISCDKGDLLYVKTTINANDSASEDNSVSSDLVKTRLNKLNLPAKYSATANQSKTGRLIQGAEPDTLDEETVQTAQELDPITSDDLPLKEISLGEKVIEKANMKQVFSSEVIMDLSQQEPAITTDTSFADNDSFVSSTPIAFSTPCPTKAILTSASDLPEGNYVPSSRKHLLDVIDQLGNAPDVGTDVVERVEHKEENVVETLVVVENGLPEESLEKENKRLSEVISIRESKLVALSKENLGLEETNAILRSQLEQLDQVHKAEESEFEEMKTEFTNRISDVENKFHVAAKERDLYKKQLEETQQCLSSDMERQLKEFQLLSQQKDEQIVQLMEEGEKLSREVLQRSNNLKKLRLKEKETSEENESLKTRLKETESEMERLTVILKERDEHKKEQDDAINKLNAYIKKQDEQLSKQKVELEESSAKLPSLQTALDNAYKEITELHKANAAKSNEVQEATLSVEMSAKEDLRIAMEKLRKESQRDCDVLAIEITDLQSQLSRSEQQAARREDNLRQEITDLHMRLQEAETRNQELTQTASAATRPLLRQIENLQHSYGSQQTSWEKLEKNLTERLAEAQNHQAMCQEKERAATQKSLDLNARVALLDSQNANYRQEKSRLEAELEMEMTKSEVLEEFKIRETGKVGALKAMHTKQLETMLVEKGLLEQQLVVERTKYESEQKRFSRLEDQLMESTYRSDNDYKADEDDVVTQSINGSIRSRKASVSSQMSLSDTKVVGSGGTSTAAMEELRATIRHKEGEMSSLQSAISTLETGREYLTEELTTVISTNEKLLDENSKLSRLGQSYQELQAKYNALLQMYGEKQEETEELKLDLQDIKLMYKAQIQELLSGR